MTLDLRNIWYSVNKALSTINALLLGLILMGPVDYKKLKERKIPLVYNIILLIVLIFIAFVMTYGAYRRQRGY